MLRHPWKAYVSYSVNISMDSQVVTQKMQSAHIFTRGWGLNLKEEKDRYSEKRQLVSGTGGRDGNQQAKRTGSPAFTLVQRRLTSGSGLS